MVGKEVKAREIFKLNPPSFENKLLYCQFTSKYADDYEIAAGYTDGANECLTKHSKKELEALLEASMASGDDDYEKGYRAAINDFIKENGGE